jgi:hypothetical protein
MVPLEKSECESQCIERRRITKTGRNKQERAANSNKDHNEENGFTVNQWTVQYGANDHQAIVPTV